MNQGVLKVGVWGNGVRLRRTPFPQIFLIARRRRGVTSVKSLLERAGLHSFLALITPWLMNGAGLEFLLKRSNLNEFSIFTYDTFYDIIVS